MIVFNALKKDSSFRLLVEVGILRLFERGKLKKMSRVVSMKNKYYTESYITFHGGVCLPAGSHRFS